jgi:3-oxoadipate enol-lactonase
MPYASINGIHLYYEIRGEGDPVLLIPGLASDINTWSPLHKAELRYRWISIENRGAGRSSKPAGPYSMEMMADDTAAMLRSLQISRAHVIGKSMGGMIAQHLAVRHPELVRSLTLVSTVMKHDDYGKQLLQLGRIVARDSGLFVTLKQAYLLSYSREYCSRNQGRLAEAEALLSQFDTKEVLAGYFEQSLACEAHDFSRFAGQARQPALIITGKDDLITPAESARELAAALPNAQLHILPRGGHGLWREFPEDVNPIVADFLRIN